MTLMTPSRTAGRHSAFSFTATLARHIDVWRQRQALKTLDQSRLDDLGLSREQADTEARRQFWDAPETWRC